MLTGITRAERARQPRSGVLSPDGPPIMVCGNSFPLVRDLHSNPLRSRERRFESCRGHPETTSETTRLSRWFRGLAVHLFTDAARHDATRSATFHGPDADQG
jgi:hypothetical protein